MVRSFVGGLELIVSLLKSDDREVSVVDFLFFSFSIFLFSFATRAG